MKRTIVASTIVSALLLAFGCAEDNHGRLDQLDESLPAPQPVEVTKVKPISGGAVLWVKIPDDKNIKGVVASYTRGGVNVEAKVSRYVDSLKVEGYADTDEHEIEVCSFNVNEVKSKPVTVKFTPETPAIRKVTPTMIATAGGVKVKITGNDSKSDLAVCLLRDENVDNAGKPVSDIKWKEVTTLFTASNDITLTRRGIEATEAVFGVYVRDRWGNISDTVKTVLAPLPEIMIPKAATAVDVDGKPGNAKGFSYNSGAVWSLDDNLFKYEAERSSFPVKGLWDGSGESKSPHFLAVDKAPIPCWFTIDLGCEVELSRIATLPRIDYPQIFGDAHIRNFEFWGSNNPSGVPGEGEHGFDDSWKCLGKFIQFKPSGYLDDGTPGVVTQEDREYFNKGNDFELDSEAYPDAYYHFRYLRVVLTSYVAWEMLDAANAAAQFGELSLYGRVTKTDN